MTTMTRPRTMLVAAISGALLITAPGVAQADRLDPATVGRSSGSAAPAVAGSSSVSAQAVSAQATCSPAEGFSRTAGGALYRLVDAAPGTTAAGTLTETGKVGSGWSSKTFAWMASGGDGVVYALTWGGQLKWYKYSSSRSRWLSGSGTTMGSGFVPNKKIINIALGANGDFYVVRANRQLVVYRHTGRLTGARTWASSRGWLIGSGWSGNEVIIPNGDGTLYRQYRGKLYWYRHSNPAARTVSWARAKVIGTGWKFYDVLPAGGGVLYATIGGNGSVMVYQHADPTGGSATWSTSRGTRKGSVRADSFGLTIDPDACS